MIQDPIKESKLRANEKSTQALVLLGFEALSLQFAQYPKERKKLIVEFYMTVYGIARPWVFERLDTRTGLFTVFERPFEPGSAFAADLC